MVLLGGLGVSNETSTYWWEDVAPLSRRRLSGSSA